MTLTKNFTIVIQFFLIQVNMSSFYRDERNDRRRPPGFRPYRPQSQQQGFYKGPAYQRKTNRVTGLSAGSRGIVKRTQQVGRNGGKFGQGVEGRRKNIFAVQAVSFSQQLDHSETMSQYDDVSPDEDSDLDQCETMTVYDDVSPDEMDLGDSPATPKKRQNNNLTVTLR